MTLLNTVLILTALCQAPLLAGAPSPAIAPASMSDLSPVVARLEADLGAQVAPEQRQRLRQGLQQVVQLWRPADGDAQAFEELVRTHFAADQPARDALFSRLEMVMESLDGHMLEIGRDLRWYTDLDLGPLYPVDELLSNYSPSAHLADDFFANKLAFVVLLNFPVSTLEQRLTEGTGWTRRQWAEARLVDRFAKRVPAEVNLAIAEAAGESDRYIAGYNIWMHHLLEADGTRLFPAGLRLLSHWNLRDELKSQYANGAEGLKRQRMIQKVMERIVEQSIPAVVVDNPAVDWRVWTNEVAPAAVSDSDRPPAASPVSAASEPDTRYAMWLGQFKAQRLLDPYSLRTPTLMARVFEEDRQVPEASVRAMFEAVLSSPHAGRVARVIEQRLGRPLEPFDIWYKGFRAGAGIDERALDAITRRRYPDAAAFDRDLPNLLTALGFSSEKAAWLASKIEVDPARGSGHAMESARRGDNAHLRTRIGAQGMDYKGFNIALHELGHNVEQVFSLNRVDHTLLRGVPSTAFTEAIAYVFQDNDLRLLGQAVAGTSGDAEKVLNEFWQTYEICGVSLVDMTVWHWMYEHPDATPTQTREAVLSSARDVWNRYYAPVLGVRDSTLLAIYSHMVDSRLYLPDYAIGHLISFQVKRQIESTGRLGEEVERMTTIGNVAPDLWMQQATGRKVGPEALLAATEEALRNRQE